MPSATWSGICLRCMAWASWARVRGSMAISRRQIWRAASSGLREVRGARAPGASSSSAPGFRSWSGSGSWFWSGSSRQRSDQAGWTGGSETSVASRPSESWSPDLRRPGPGPGPVPVRAWGPGQNRSAPVRRRLRLLATAHSCARRHARDPVGGPARRSRGRLGRGGGPVAIAVGGRDGAAVGAVGSAIRGRGGVGVWLLRAHPQLLLDLLLDLDGQVGVLLQEVARVLLALAELIALVGVPGPGLADDALLHAEVDEAALAADADAVKDVELGHLERWAHLVLDDLDAGPVADRVGAVLERLDAPHVQP